MANKIEEIAKKKKQQAKEAHELEVAKFAKKVANEVLSGVRSLNSDERRVLEGTIAGLAKSVAESVVLSNERFDKELKDNFSKLLTATEANKPEKYDNSANEELFERIGKSLASFESSLDSLELSPEIKLSSITKDELKTEVDRILKKLPKDSKREVAIAYEKAGADKYINVRLTDGIKFYSAFGGGGGSSGSATESKQDNIISELQAIKSTPVSEANTDGSVTIGDETTTILAENENRKSATIVNDSDETIYLSLSDTAVLNSGIRVNAEGGSAEIEDYTGEISGISASGSKVVTVVEL